MRTLERSAQALNFSFQMPLLCSAYSAFSFKSPFPLPQQWPLKQPRSTLFIFCNSLLSFSSASFVKYVIPLINPSLFIIKEKKYNALWEALHLYKDKESD
jgi:hypothetical protein